MRTLIDERELIDIKLDFSIDKKDPTVRVLSSTTYYDKLMNDFKKTLDDKLIDIAENCPYAKEIKEGFKVIMKTKFNNGLSIEYQIILFSNMERMFIEYLKWLRGFKSVSESFYVTLPLALEEFVNSGIITSYKIEDFLDLTPPKTESKQLEEKKEHIFGQLDEYSKGIYITMLCTIMCNENETREEQRVCIERLIKELRVIGSINDYIKKALYIDSEFVEEFVKQFKSDDFKYFFIVDALIIIFSVGCSEKKEVQHICDICDIFKISKEDIRVCSKLALGVLEQRIS